MRNRISLAQTLSPQLDKHHKKFIPGLKQFDLFNMDTQEIYGRGPFTFEMTSRSQKDVEFINRDGVKVPAKFDVCRGLLNNSEVEICQNIKRAKMPQNLGVYTIQISIKVTRGHAYAIMKWGLHE